MTNPTPSALAELVADLRADAAFYYAAGEYDKSVGYENSAKKLEAALAQPANSATVDEVIAEYCKDPEFAAEFLEAKKRRSAQPAKGDGEGGNG